MNRYYISGAVTNDPDYELKFSEAERILTEHGYKVINPVREVPFVAGKEWNWYMKKDISLLMKCNAIIMLDGWEKSRGARLERIIAEQLGYDVFEFEKFKGNWK